MSLLNLFREPKHIVLQDKCIYCGINVNEYPISFTCNKCGDLKYLSSEYDNFGSIPVKLRTKSSALVQVSDDISKKVFIQKRDEILEEWHKYKKKKEELELKKNLKLLGLRK